MVRPMVHSQKHYVQLSLTEVLAGAAQSFVIAESVQVVDKNSVQEVENGSTIKAVYVETWVKAGVATNLGQVVAMLVKLPSGVGTATTTEMAALGNYDNKKNILYTTQGLVNNEDQNAKILVKGWFKIPKGKQRMGLGDSIEVRIFAQTTTLDWCGFTTYKEYT